MLRTCVPLSVSNPIPTLPAIPPPVVPRLAIFGSHSGSISDGLSWWGARCRGLPPADQAARGGWPALHRHRARPDAGRVAAIGERDAEAPGRGGLPRAGEGRSDPPHHLRAPARPHGAPSPPPGGTPADRHARHAVARGAPGGPPPG